MNLFIIKPPPTILILLMLLHNSVQPYWPFSTTINIEPPKAIVDRVITTSRTSVIANEKLGIFFEHSLGKSVEYIASNPCTLIATGAALFAGLFWYEKYRARNATPIQPYAEHTIKKTEVEKIQLTKNLMLYKYGQNLTDQKTSILQTKFGGYENIPAEIPAIINKLNNQERGTEEVTYDNKLLLNGTRGYGKTTLAHGLAEETSRNLIVTGRNYFKCFGSKENAQNHCYNCD